MLFRPNQNLYKVMWAAEGPNIIWNMQREEHDAHCFALVSLLGNYLDVEAWTKEYEYHFRRWLAEDDLTIYALDSPLLASMLNAIKLFNQKEDTRLYYWFDVDRTNPVDFHWESSPLSGEKLRKLPHLFPAINRYVAENDFMVFPATDSP